MAVLEFHQQGLIPVPDQSVGNPSPYFRQAVNNGAGRAQREHDLQVVRVDAGGAATHCVSPCMRSYQTFAASCPAFHAPSNARCSSSRYSAAMGLPDAASRCASKNAGLFAMDLAPHSKHPARYAPVTGFCLACSQAGQAVLMMSVMRPP